MKSACTREHLADCLSFRGYSLQDWTGTPNYKNRKGKVLAIVDLRSGKLIATYSTYSQIRLWIEKQSWPNNA